MDRMVLRKRIETQGYCGLDDATLDRIGPWLRWSPLLCTLAMMVGVTQRSPALLWGLAAIAAAGALLPFHPFDLLYNFGVRHLTGTGPLPRQGAQRRFACALAAAWLLATGWAFHTGANALAYALGASLILVAALVSLTNICIPSMIYNALWRRSR